MTAQATGAGERMLSTRQIATRYDVHPRTVIRWINSRGLAGVRVGGHWRVPEDAMDEWLTRGRVTRRA
jgi:excisionase family DNA binding protein